MCSFLILENRGSEPFWGEYDNVHVLNLYLGNSILIRLFRRIGFLVSFSINHNVKRLLKDVDIIVLPDSIATNPVLKYLKRRKTSKQRLILYCNNRYNLIRNISLELAKKSGFELWSYNREDCLMYSLSYTNQFMDRKRILQVNRIDGITYDAVFVGSKKKRSKEIRNIKGTLDDLALNTWFYVRNMVDLSGNKCIDDSFVDYDYYLGIAKKSKCIVDIVSDSNEGLTMRPIEALFLKKKLITNYQGIVEEDFYKSENIFIYGKDNIKDLREFISSGFVDVDDDIVRKYDSVNFYNNVSNGSKDCN